MGGFPDRFTVGPGIIVTRTSISRTTGVFNQTTELHPLTGVQATMAGFGGITSHKTLGSAATGALVGGLLPGVSAVTEAFVALNKKIDTRTMQVTIAGPAFYWTFAVNPDSPPHQKLAEVNDRAAKFTADPHGVNLSVKLDAHHAAQEDTVREAGKVERKLVTLAQDNERDRNAIDRLATKVFQAASCWSGDSRSTSLPLSKVAPAVGMPTRLGFPPDPAASAQRRTTQS